MSIAPLNPKDVNALNSDCFIKLFGNVVEHYPAAAIGILKNRPFNSADDISEAIDNYLDGLNVNEKEKILQLHPDLAGRLSDLGKLTVDSTQEQISAGLDKLSTAEKNELNALNERYKTKFGFPFVICARENKVTEILEAIERRIENDKLEELKIGIEEVKHISKMRIKLIVSQNV